ncbi:dihydrodipicolinate synthase family protein [Jatrophihabitans sp. YIM 134969]
MTRPEVLTAVPTLFGADGAIDPGETTRLHTALREHVDGVFVAGTTGEFPALQDTERIALFELALQAWTPDTVVAHVGSPATSQAVALTRQAVTLGVRRLAALPPYYFAVDAGDLLAHFGAIVDAAGDAEVYAYLFPDRTGVDLAPAVLAELTRRTGLAGAKLSGRAAARFGEYVAELPPGTSAWSGADTEMVSVAGVGGRGLVSGMSAADPAAFAALATAVESGDDTARAAATARVQTVADVLHGSPAGIKAALHAQGYRATGSRMHQGPDARVDPAAVAALFPA